MIKNAERAWGAWRRRAAGWPAPLRWELRGVLLLAGILAGGALTAYGGMLLLLLLWALCMGGLALLLGAAWQAAFPGRRLRDDRAFCRVYLAGAAVGLAVLAALILYRRTVYGEDAINYYAKQQLLFGSFSANGFYGVHQLADNLLRADYKMFLNLFITLPYLLLPRTVNGFMLSYAVSCFLPTWFALLLTAKKVWSWRQGAAEATGGQGRAGLFYALCMAAMVLWPMFLQPATHGMPDAFGLAFAACILLLTADFRFESLPPRRLTALFAATFALVLTRRWYMFWIVGYYAVYAAAVLLGAARRRALGPTFRRMLAFGLPALLGIVLPLALTFRTILTTDYADIYGAYYGGGFGVNLAGMLAKLGAVYWLLCGAGLLAALRRPASRAPAAVVTLASLAAMALFTRNQSLGDHQALILAPACLGLLFCLFAAVCSLSGAAARRGGAAALGLFFCLNFANALRLPGRSVSTVLLADTSLDLTRRTDLAAMRAVTDFVLANCAADETVYLNIDTDGYSGSTFAYSDTSHPALQTMILWENSVPSTHGFPTGIWSSRYVMVTDNLAEGGLVGGVNTALRTDTPAAAHYRYVTAFALDGVTLYCYERTAPPDAAEAAYFKALFAAFDARWPALYSRRIDAYLAGQGG